MCSGTIETVSQSVIREFHNDLHYYFLEPADLCKKSSRIRDIPMFTKLSVPETEHVDNVVLYLVARWWIIQEAFACVRSCDGIEDKDKIAIGNDLIDCGAVVWNGRKESFMKLDKSGAALIRIRVVLDIVVVHVPGYRRQIMPFKNHFIKFPDNLLIHFGIHSVAPFLSSSSIIEIIIRRLRVVGKTQPQARRPPACWHSEIFREA
jgi:hypothetical protein